MDEKGFIPENDTADGTAPQTQSSSKFSIDPKSFLKVLVPPRQGAVTVLWLGLILVVGMFVFKQLSLHWVKMSLSGRIESSKVMARAKADSISMEKDLAELRIRLGREESREKRDKDYIKELRDKIEKERKELEKKQKEERYDMREDMLEAEETSASYKASTYSRIQWVVFMTFLFDLLLFVGSALVMLSTMHIVIDDKAAVTLKIYAIVCTGCILMALLHGNLTTTALQLLR